MQVDQFVRSRQAEWQELSDLLDLCQRNVRGLSAGQIHRLSQLYRAATSDLALAQRDFPNDRVTVYLNQLVARGHATIYRSEPVPLSQAGRFVAQDFPRLFRQTWRYTFAAALLLFVPALVAAALTGWQPESAQWVLPAEAQELIGEIEQQELWTDIPVGERPYASSFIMTNNIQVAFLAFAGGVTAGLLTVWILIFNGLLLGGMVGLTLHYGIGFDLLTFVVGHGVIELTVICIAGGSGLLMGWAILNPGLCSRRDHWPGPRWRAIQLVGACIPLLIIAGLIEGFLSPAEAIPWPVKWAVGLGSGLLLFGYLLLAGRRTSGMMEAG